MTVPDSEKPKKSPVQETGGFVEEFTAPILCKFCPESRFRPQQEETMWMNGGKTEEMLRGVHTLGYIVESAAGGICPYHAAKHMVARADIVVCSARAFLDPKLSNSIGFPGGESTIVVFEEASNIGTFYESDRDCVDRVCTEAMSVYLTLDLLKEANVCLKDLKGRLSRIPPADQSLQDEYQVLSGKVRRLRNNRIYIGF